ncbi:hypothetical protein [Streptomyces cyaneofuscatus]|uniref:Uncharacterized protein n=1 Tax=Streptomyces cyaneofuscatus TaxID=66883 RepID=A0ABZ1F5S8_9ACTN|nr:hypothetical protein [Streptomyces cyaneofuscatus]WSB11722.1 hypothetical protein OG849_32880 [Streptomyces cyaneofuscatus]WSD44745.1 hypothetical protein OG857_02520 [Streptomyces cyaneofuscatus]
MSASLRVAAAHRPLDLGGRIVTAEVVTDVADLTLDGTAIVVNTGMRDAWVGADPRKPLPPLHSAQLTDVRVGAADSLVVLRTSEDAAERVSEIVTEPGWHLLGDLLGDDLDVTGGVPFDRATPLWKGPQADLGRMDLAPAQLLRETAEASPPVPFEVRVNLWFAPAGTDCFIHNAHDFIEVHTQVLGTGRMQKFARQDQATRYEDQVMSPGWTTPHPFCATRPDGSFHYPWHQYRADTDCVWLAVEYHRVTEPTTTEESR